MNAPDVLRALRKKGYVVAVVAGVVTATGVTPKDPARAAALLTEHQADLLTILEAEEILNGKLK